LSSFVGVIAVLIIIIIKGKKKDVVHYPENLLRPGTSESAVREWEGEAVEEEC
jgi:hypothetical protein